MFSTKLLKPLIFNFKCTNFSFTYSLFKNCNQNVPCRTLFHPESLRIDTFTESCNNIRAVTNKDTFLTEMQKKRDEATNSFLFQDDISKFIRIASDDEDLLLLKDLLKKFCIQSNNFRFGAYNLATEIMRMYYFLNKPKEALEITKYPECSHIFFKEVTSLIILVQQQLRGKKYPRNLVVLFFASCYKLNTPESLEEALNLYNKFIEIEYTCSSRAICYLGALALQQNQPEAAIKVLNDVRKFGLAFNLLAVAYCDNNEFEKAIETLHRLLLIDVPKVNLSLFVTPDTLDYLKKAFSNGSPEHAQKLEKLREQFLIHDLIKKDECMDTYLNEELWYGVTPKTWNENSKRR